MECKVNLEERVSKKTGEKYEVLIIEFPNGYKKQVFLEYAEIFMLKQLF